MSIPIGPSIPIEKGVVNHPEATTPRRLFPRTSNVKMISAIKKLEIYDDIQQYNIGTINNSLRIDKFI